MIWLDVILWIALILTGILILFLALLLIAIIVSKLTEKCPYRRKCAHYMPDGYTCNHSSGDEYKHECFGTYVVIS
jgi:type IV secretory pathway VirB6-like protein